MERNPWISSMNLGHSWSRRCAQASRNLKLETCFLYMNHCKAMGLATNEMDHTESCVWKLNLMFAKNKTQKCGCSQFCGTNKFPCVTFKTDVK